MTPQDRGGSDDQPHRGQAAGHHLRGCNLRSTALGGKKPFGNARGQPAGNCLLALVASRVWYRKTVTAAQLMATQPKGLACPRTVPLNHPQGLLRMFLAVAKQG